MADGRVIIEAILDTANVSKNVKTLGKELDGVSWKNIKEGDTKAQSLGKAFKGAGTAATLSLTAPIAAAGKMAFDVAAEYEGATSRIQAALGTTREDAEHFKDIGATIYEGGWGESLDQVTESLLQTKSTIRDIDDNGLQTVTQTALMLSSTFGADVNETIRGTNALMEGFGLSATEASDLMTAGMQRGLNYTDELGDNLAEYSVRWGESGMSASQYFSLLETGTSNGAYNLDKVGDFLNEFLTSLSDGRMDEQIGRLSEGTQSVFDSFKNGQATAEDVLNAVIGDMGTMTDETERASIASDLWSSLGEDNAMGMLLSLGNVTDSYGDVAGAAQNAGDAASDSFANKAESAMRTLKGSLEPFGEPLLNIAKMVADVAGTFGNWLSSMPTEGQQAVFIILAIVAAIGPVLSLIGTLITVIPAIASAIGIVKGAMSALNTTMMANPIGLIITIIGLLVAAFIYFWNTSEEFRNFWIGLWDSICATMAPIVEWINANVIQPIIGFFSMLGEAVPVVWSTITSAIGTALDWIFSIISSVLSTIVGFWTGVWDTVSSVVSSVWNGISGIISGVAGAVSGTISSVFSGILGFVTGVWNGIKSAIETPMNAARDIVMGVINAIKGFFNFNITWPHIPMPHFRINPDGWQIGDLLQGSIPSLGIDWYAKGGVFNGASVIGVGEAGPEAAVPLSGRRMQPFAEAIADNMGSESSAADEIRALRKELPKMLAFYIPRALMINEREFARLMAETEGKY